MSTSMQVRTDWTRDEVAKIYHAPLMELISRANRVHAEANVMGEVQVCTLLSVKTGGCPEDCGYCSQSAHHETAVAAEKLMDVNDVLQEARRAKQSGSTRFCMGAAWRKIRDNRDFDNILEMVRGVSSMGMEVCCTLGMLNPEQAAKLKEAGLYAYNHNLDTSEGHYGNVTSTRQYQDRLDTLQHVREANISVCCGGILGIGETHDDRIDLLHTVAAMPAHPESFPVNALVAIEGTPMGENAKVEVWDMIRMIAAARILMPKTMVRLSAGRIEMSAEAQAMCFLAGANSIFAGDKLLTTPNNDLSDDERMFQALGLTPRESYKDAKPEQVPQSASQRGDLPVMR